MRRPRRRLESGGEALMLAAMVDMFINLLLFLLHMYGTDPSAGSADSLQLAASTATRPVEGAVLVVVRMDAVAVNGRPVAALHADDRDALLLDVLKSKGKAARLAAEEKGEPYSGDIVLEIDRRIPWPDLREILRVAGKAGFWNLRFVVSSKSN